jgi:phage gp16-like protein
MTLVGVPGRFDRSSTHRRGMLAKVHIAKAQLRLSDDDYAAVVLTETGRTSARDCTDRELHDLLKAFERRGFTAKAKRPGPKPADHPVARKARALWISLHHLGAVADPSEKALEAFARRQLKCDRLQWADQALAYRLIEALKAMGARAGWDCSLEGVRPEASVIVLKRRLVDAIVDHLRDACLVPDRWSVERVARELTGIEIPSILFATTEELDRLAKALGEKLRKAVRP